METLSYFYFAYGSNLNCNQMKCRCPGAQFLGRGILPGYRFIIYSRGYASVVKENQTNVWGGIWKISHPHIVTLDNYEGISSNCYYREIIQVKLADKSQEFMNCEIYFGTDTAEGVPQPDYMEIVIQGALDCGLPKSYISDNLNIWIKS